MGEGEPYDYYDEEADTRVHSTGVKMHTTRIYKTNTKSQKLKNYIYKLYNPETEKSKLLYTKIVIESASAVRVDNIEKVGDHYECVAYYYPKIITYSDNKTVSTYMSCKRIICYITPYISQQVKNVRRKTQ